MIKRISKSTAIPKDALDALWTLNVLLTNRTFVEGFAGVKKCSNEGRALMQLDYQQFIVNAEKLSSLR
jgi:syndetin